MLQRCVVGWFPSSTYAQSLSHSVFNSHFPYEVISHCVGFDLYALNNLSCYFLLVMLGIFYVPVDYINTLF